MAPKVVARPERTSFSRLNEVLDLPNLIDIQRASFDWFIGEGLRDTIDDISPIEDYTGTLAVDGAVAGAVAGGGLTVIANAPNPAGFGILKSSFGEEGISPMGLLLAALAPTAVVCVCLWFLPHL